MSRRPRLRNRLIWTHLAVVSAVVITVAVITRLLTPTLFERTQLRAGSGRGQGPGGPANPSSPELIQTDWEQALNLALLVSVLVGLALAVLLAIWLSRRILRGLSSVQEATGRMAAGDYQHAIAAPPEAELADLADSVNELGSRLAATELSRAKLISDLAHELRNPLSTIEGYMEGLIDGVIPASDETYSILAAEAQRVQRLTDDLSLLSRAQEGAMQLELAPCDLGRVVDTVGKRLRSQYEAKGVSLVIDDHGELPVIADSERLIQALTNVIGNALTHTPPGGEVRVSSRREGPIARIDIEDTGRGIPVDQLEAIFERFTRLDPTGRGTGIGLNIARTITRLHGGELRAHSDGVGTGSTFTLTLPLAD